ncbi:16S rRNA (guanine(527)-N(7))-methyltransferase RsmG [Acidobacterium sp. S8]|uniref:16S rRNA (guanine(527)-N(7))-methyltransferase RsmG n=1 Tax=Acidobacterium sp. S8 TaxID=1641854 RepID=UPI00131DEB5A|nr:16S rRNA (guanine(527)-N(7))-methyltransferase RsmG [Acidobacterium sp. S8]
MTAVLIEKAVLDAGLQPLPEEALERFQEYLALLLKWNERLNLTSVRQPEEILTRHFIECIFAAQKLPADIPTLLDFGSGGGFPGLPIALCRPEIFVTLGESQSKKASFLREVVRTLKLGNADVYQGRLEQLDWQFQAVTLRAVDKMQNACRAAVKAVSLGGYLVLLTTATSSPALIADMSQLDWQPSLSIPNSDQRCLLIGQKP